MVRTQWIYTAKHMIFLSLISVLIFYYLIRRQQKTMAFKWKTWFFFSDNSMFAIIVNFGYELGENPLRDTTLGRSLRVFPGRVSCSDLSGNPEMKSLRTKQCCCCLPTFAPCCLKQRLCHLHCYCYHRILVSLACRQDQWLSRMPRPSVPVWGIWCICYCWLSGYRVSVFLVWRQPLLHHSAHTM